MKKLYGSEAKLMLPVSNGAIIIKSNDSGKNPVEFDLYTIDSMRSVSITKSDYLLNKFGNCFEKITAQLDAPFSCKTAFLPKGRLIAVRQDGTGVLFSAEGNIIRQVDFRYEDCPPDDIVMYDMGLFAVYSSKNVLLKFNPTTLGRLMRFGSPDTDTFDLPISLCGLGDRLYICNAGDNRISIFEPESYRLLDYASFKEPLLQYIRFKGSELVLLESGVYKI